MMWVTMGLFGLSVLASAVPIQIVQILVYAWFFGVGIGLLTALLSFIVGLIRVFRGRPEMFLSSFVILLIVGIVGFGSCMANISLISMHSGGFGGI